MLPVPATARRLISSYVVANHETWRRGVVLSFASAFLQSLRGRGVRGYLPPGRSTPPWPTVCTSERYIEIVSYALIALIGLRLVWVKGRAMLGAWRQL